MASPLSVNVATFNVNCDCQEEGSSNCSNASLVASTIANCDADVVCLQESNAKWEKFLLSADDRANNNFNSLQHIYPHVKFHNADRNKWAGFAVFSKFPIKTFEVIKETERGWYPAGLVTLDIVPIPAGQQQQQKKERTTTPVTTMSSSSSSISSSTSITSSPSGSTVLQLLIVHLRAPVEFKYPERYWWGGHTNWIGGYFSKTVKSKRLDEIQTFSRALKPGLPTIILGDFNERRNNSGCLQYLEEELEFANTPKHMNKNSWSFQILGGWLTVLSFDYDHILYSKNDLEPIATKLNGSDSGHARVHENSGSDHCLVSAEFRFKKF